MYFSFINAEVIHSFVNRCVVNCDLNAVFLINIDHAL